MTMMMLFCLSRHARSIYYNLVKYLTVFFPFCSSRIICPVLIDSVCSFPCLLVFYTFAIFVFVFVVCLLSCYLSAVCLFVLVFGMRSLDMANSFILKLTQRIQLRSSTQTDATQGNKPQEDANLFHKTFPFFIWLLRDVVLSLPKDCHTIKDYFLTRVGSLLIRLS